MTSVRLSRTATYTVRGWGILRSAERIGAFRRAMRATRQKHAVACRTVTGDKAMGGTAQRRLDCVGGQQVALFPVVSLVCNEA